jgi:hypothetical protein
MGGVACCASAQSSEEEERLKQEYLKQLKQGPELQVASLNSNKSSEMISVSTSFNNDAAI